MCICVSCPFIDSLWIPSILLLTVFLVIDRSVVRFGRSVRSGTEISSQAKGAGGHTRNVIEEADQASLLNTRGVSKYEKEKLGSGIWFAHTGCTCFYQLGSLKRVSPVFQAHSIRRIGSLKGYRCFQLLARWACCSVYPRSSPKSEQEKEQSEVFVLRDFQISVSTKGFPSRKSAGYFPIHVLPSLFPTCSAGG